MTDSKVLLIGLDGVDFNLFKVLISRNIIPNLARLSKNGAHGHLLSTVPLQTPITWTSFITGKNAGKHGIFGFFAYKNNSYALKVLNSLERKSQTLWHILNRYGKRVGIFNLPSLFPPEKIDGYMVCGMLAPSINSNFTYPKLLKEKLLRSVKDYEIDIGMTMSAKDSKDMLLQKTYEITEKRIRAAKFLLKEFHCDLTMLIFTETDRILHFFLKDMDGDSKYKNIIADYFHFLDKSLGELIERVSKDTTIIVVSDHGMEPFRKVFYVNNFLREIGMVSQEKKSFNYVAHSFIEGCFKVIVNSMVKLKLSPEILKPFLPQWLFNRLTIILGSGGNFDWSKTKAYFSSSIGDSIVINLKGRQPQGIVPMEEYEAVRDKIIQEIKAIKDPDTREGIVEGVYKREELFSGDFVNEAADIIIKLKDGYIPHSSTDTEDILTEKNPFGLISSDHTRNAILILYGNEIKKGFSIKEATIFDIAPTILTLMYVPLSADFDGRVLIETFKEEHVDLYRSSVVSEGERLRARIKELKLSGKIK